MKLRLVILIGTALLAVQCKNQGNQQKNTETVVKQDVVWLFDGSSTDHFRDIDSDQFPEHGWVVEGDVLG